MIYIYRMTRGITNNSRKKNAKIWCPFGPSRTGGCHVARQSLWPPCGRIKDGIRRVMKKRDWLSESRSSKKGFNCGSHLAKIASIDQSSSNVSSTISKLLALDFEFSQITLYRTFCPITIPALLGMSRPAAGRTKIWDTDLTKNADFFRVSVASIMRAATPP
jgi:hypothetical protein